MSGRPGRTGLLSDLGRPIEFGPGDDAPTVIKAGGSLLANLEDLREVASAVGRRRAAGERVLMVVSALSGVTEQLELALWRAVDRRSDGRQLGRLVDRLRSRHLAIAGALEGGRRVALELERQLAALELDLAAVCEQRSVEPIRRARILSYGERLSAPLAALALRGCQVDARSVTAEEAGLRADGPRLDARCDLAASFAGIRRLRSELSARTLVLTGFYGVDRSGREALFGRGGSDYTAGVTAELLGASRLEFWKDVPALMTADPHRVPGARALPELSFTEVSRLAQAGSNVLHRRCLQPLRGRGVEVAVRGLADQIPGTRVVESGDGTGPGVRALAARPGLCEIGFESAAPERSASEMGEIVSRLADHGIRSEVVDAGRAGLRCRIAQDEKAVALAALYGRDAATSTPLRLRGRPAVIGVVGRGVARDRAVRARLRSLLDGHATAGPARVRRVAAEALLCLVDPRDLEPVLNCLHAAFFGRRRAPFQGPKPMPASVAGAES